MFLAQGHPQQDTVPVRPSFTRSQSDLSASSSNNHILSNSPSVLVKKRHSTYITVPEPASPIVGTAPQRPPRNPARPPAVLPAAGTPFPVRPKAKGKLTRPSTATGTRADVTPWEFKNTGTREDVTPWELHPAPDYQDSKESPKTAADHSPPKVTYRSSPRPSTSQTSSHGSGMHFSDLPLVRRRKSTGSKAPKPRSNTFTVGGSRSQIRQPDGQSQLPLQPHGRPSELTGPSKSVPSTPKLAGQVPAGGTGPAAPPTPLLLHPISHPSISLPPPTTSSASASPLQKSTSRASSEKPKETDLKFSTADRTILEELKRNISARAAQFVVKGGGAGIGSGGPMGWGAQGIGAGKKHHPYTRQEVPYPKNYERNVLDLDVWETTFCQEICNSLTWHVFEKPPTKVLDLGCGTGAWLLNCAQTWRNCHFVGVDIVPLHPDLQQVGSSALASRITWVQSNFLEGLPFPNEEFDFVHIKRIALGIPEDKWDTLFEEITRVMKPGAAFEMIEEDLFFPGKKTDDDADHDHEFGTESRPSDQQRRPTSSARSSERANSEEHDTDSVVTSSGGSRGGSSASGRQSDDVWSPVTTTSSGSPSLLAASGPTGGFGKSVLTPPRTVSPLPILPHSAREVGSIEEDAEGENIEAQASSSQGHHTKGHERDATITPATAQPARAVRKVPSSPRLFQSSKSLPTNRPSSASGRLNTSSTKPPLPPLLDTLPPLTSHSNGSGFRYLPLPSSQKPPGSTMSLLNPSSVPPSSAMNISDYDDETLANLATMMGVGPSAITFVGVNGMMAPPLKTKVVSKPTVSPFLHRSLPKIPVNPRDHSLLEMIYTEMFASRFINLSPLSLLANMLGLHFKDVRTNPPLQFSFPPLRREPEPDEGPATAPMADSDPDEDARDAIIPNPSGRHLPAKRGRKASHSSSHSRVEGTASPTRADDEDTEDTRWITMRNLVKSDSPYVSLDGSRASALSPAVKASSSVPISQTKVPGLTPGPEPSGEPSEHSPIGPETPTPASVLSARALTATRKKNHLPNTTFNMDVRTLNLHLSLRVSEILACSESMWEWVLEYQKEVRAQKAEMAAKRAQRSRSGSLENAQARRSLFASLNGSTVTAESSQKTSIVEMTREDFDELLSRFEMDMQDQMVLGQTLKDRFSWSVFESPATAERNAFNNECRKWLEWEQEQRRKKSPHSSPDNTPRPSTSRPLSTFSASNASNRGDTPTLDNLSPQNGGSTSRPWSSHSREVTQSKFSPLNSEASLVGGRDEWSDATTLRRSKSQASSSGSAASRLTAAPTTRRLSRAMRVFVAWKAST